jgi:hypothetical protein
MEKQKQDIIESIQKALSSEMTFIQDRDMNTIDKLNAMDILWNTIKFLDNYDKNIEILNKNKWEKDK